MVLEQSHNKTTVKEDCQGSQQTTWERYVKSYLSCSLRGLLTPLKSEHETSTTTKLRSLLRHLSSVFIARCLFPMTLSILKLLFFPCLMKRPSLEDDSSHFACVASAVSCVLDDVFFYSL